MSDSFGKVVQDWLPRDNNLMPFYMGIDEFLEEQLTESRYQDFDKIQPKIIADPLLGYIHFTPLEVAIIDSPLFQRLRKIRQLGLAHLVFPSLGYSRFEHSLGVVGRLNQILNKLVENGQRNSSADNLVSIIEEFRVQIRLAALLHDIGHCLYSHCSERVIEQVQSESPYPEPSYIQQVLTSHFKKEKKIAFAEVFTIALIGSVRFYDFLEQFGSFNKKELKRFLSNSANFVLGIPIDGRPDTLFLAQLISSGLDADKVDYMVREQHYSGIKLEIDLDRILSKLKVFDLKPYQLPRNLEHFKRTFHADSTFKVLGFEKGGQFAFEEFCVARLALHVKIYLHQKVRAAESQLSQSLESIASSPILRKIHNWLRLPESIIENPELIIQKFSFDGSLFNQFQANHQQIDGFKKIEARKLFHRAFSFGPMNSYSEGFEALDAALTSETLTRYFDSFNTVELRRKIIEQCASVCDDYSIEVDSGLFEEIVIEMPRLINIQQGQESIYFERATWLPLKWTIPIDKILIYFQENRALAYVFAPQEIAHIVTLVSEKVIFEASGKVFAQDSNISRTTYRQFSELKNRIAGQNFYERLPQLKPISDYLTNAEAAEKIKNVQENMMGFSSISSGYITINRITTFVNQFPEHMQDACLCFLSHLEIYQEKLLAQELYKVLNKISETNDKVGVSYLGTVSDSGGRLAYHLRSTFEEFDIDDQNFHDDFVMSNDRIVFYDDNINSGLQLINIIAELLDEKSSLPEHLQLNETHHRKLSSKEAKDRFKRIPVHVVYIVGQEGAESFIQEVLSTYLGFDKDLIHIHINTHLFKEKRIFSGTDSPFNHEQKKDLREFLSQIGEKLMTEEGKSLERIESGRLGYAKAEAMVLFPYNIPTMTVTALWHKGTVDGRPWIPLAERRRRHKGGKFLGED